MIFYLVLIIIHWVQVKDAITLKIPALFVGIFYLFSITESLIMENFK